MAKNPDSKQELSSLISEEFVKLTDFIDKMSDYEQNSDFNFEIDTKKCGARWQIDRSLRDILMHLVEWQKLMITFVDNIRNGSFKDYLPDEYRKNYHEMDKMLVDKNKNISLQDAKSKFNQYHNQMLKLVDSFSDEELFAKGYYKCTYTTNLAAYFTSVTTSPYAQAVKILKSHVKSLKTAK